MNMKALLKELVKDPQIKALYKEGFDRSFINKLIIESLMEAEEEEKQLKNRMREIARQYKDAHGTNWRQAMDSIDDDLAKEYKQIQAKIQQIRKAPKLAQKTSFMKKAQKQPIVKKNELRKTIGLLAFKKLLTDPNFKRLLSKLDVKRKEKIQKALADKVAQQLKPKANAEQVEDTIGKIISTPAIQQQIKQIATEPERAKNELVPKKLIQNIASKINAQGQQLKDLVTNLVANYGIPEKQEKAKEQMSTALVKAGVQEETALAIANNKQAVEDLGNALSTSFEPGRQSLKELYDAIAAGDNEMIKKAAEAAYNYSKSKIGANFDNTVEQVKQKAAGQSLDDLKAAYKALYDQYKVSLQLFEKVEDLEPIAVSNNETAEQFKNLIEIIIALYNFYSKAPTEEPTDEPTEEQPGQPIPSSGTVSPKVYAEIYDANLEEAFDAFEDNFLRTPFLSKQSEVLTKLVTAVSQFNNKLSEAEKQSFSRKAEPELKEANEKKYPIVKFDPKDQKLIMSEHKMMEKYLKMLVKMVTSIDPDKINTVGFEQDSRKIRAIAKQLLESIVDLMKIIASAQQEERKGLEFKEAIIREDNKKPRTQLTRDQIIDFMEESYDLIVDYGTNIEKYSRTEKEAIELKPVQDTIVKLNQVFAEMLPYFPAHSPFGKTASLKEIKKQVRGISRDIVQVMKQAKGLVERPDNFDEKAIENFSAVLLTTVDKLQKYFDLEIDDAEIKAMLPKVPPAKSASYGKDSEGIFNRIQDIIKQYSPKVQAQAKKIYKKYSSEVQKALKNGMTWAERHAKTLGDKAKPYLDKVKKAFKEVKLKVTNMLQKLGPDFGDLNLTKEDAEEVIKSMAPQFHSDVIEVEVEWVPEVEAEIEDKEPEAKKTEKVPEVEAELEDDEPEANILQDVIKKMKKDEYYSPSDSEGVELLKSFAKAVTNQDNKRGMANAIRNWFYGLESTDQFGTFKNLFFKESNDYENKLEEYWPILSYLTSAVRAYATLKYKGKPLKNRRKANKKAVEIIMRRIDEWFDGIDSDKYPNQNKYEAFSSHSGEFLLDVDKETSKVKDELGKKPEAELKGKETAEQDPGKEFLEKYEDRYNAIKELMASAEGPEIKLATRAGRKKTYFQRWWTLQKKFEDILTKFGDKEEVEEKQIDTFVNRITHLENDLKKDGYLKTQPKLKPEDKGKIKDAVKEEMPEVVNNLKQDEINKDEIIAKVTQTDEVQSAFEDIEHETAPGEEISLDDNDKEAIVQTTVEEIDFEEEFDSEEFAKAEMTFEQIVDEISELPTSHNNNKPTEKQSNNNDDDNELGDLSWLYESRQSQIQRKIEKIIEHYLKTGKL